MSDLKRWECLQCARVIDATADDYCPVCGLENPEEDVAKSPLEKASMREITTHKVNGCNDKLKVEVLGEPGCGGANHAYYIAPTAGSASGLRVDFQNGPMGEFPNGVTHEVLLAILIDRLEGFQSGPYACDDNALALEHLRGALAVLHKRTLARVARGVEGTHAV